MRATTEKQSKWKQWAWFVGIYVGSLAAFAVMVYLLRWLIVPA